MSTVIVSPCGTSLLTNSTPEHLRKLLLQTANFQEAALTPEQKQEIDSHIQHRRDLLLHNDDFSQIKRLSAELNGILTYYDEQTTRSQSTAPDQHFILVSDTYQGRKVGDLVVTWLQQQNFNATTIEIADLATSDRDTFRLSMSDLIHWCDQTLTDFRQQGWHVVFNLTGGFKSVNGFLQAVGMFYAHESVYIFQFSSQLLRIPQLPISLDKEGVVGQHLTAFRKLDLHLPLAESEWRTIPETLLFTIDGQVDFSEWGKLIWLQVKPDYYQQQLLPPLSDKFYYSSQFEKAVNNLPPDRLAIINHRIDQLSCYFESNGKDNPNSLDFKALKGKPKPPFTHECDAWSDKDAKRIFGHFEADGRYQIDTLGSHL
jgi:putative CRISPR-associated protein (TIGR02619 family)